MIATTLIPYSIRCLTWRCFKQQVISLMSWWASTISIDGLHFSSYAFWSSTSLFYSTLYLVCSIRVTSSTWKRIQNGSFWKIKIKCNRTFINSWEPRMYVEPASRIIKFSAILCKYLVNLIIKEIYPYYFDFKNKENKSRKICISQHATWEYNWYWTSQ